MNTFQKTTNIDYLKTFITPIKKTLFNRGTKRRLIDFDLPLSWYNDIIYICGLYNVNFELRKNTHDESNWYDRCTNTISMFCSDSIGFLSTYDIATTFTHELSHVIQNNIIKKYNSSGKSRYSSFSQLLQYERAAERLGYFFYKAYFRPLIKLTHRNFSAYISDDYIKYLKYEVNK